LSEIIQAIILGIAQGLTEFIPVSSSAHLALIPWFFGWGPSGLLFDTMLHWGTLLAMLFVFWRDYLALIGAWFRSITHRSLADPNARLAWFIIIGSIPAVILGFLFQDYVESLFADAQLVGFLLLITAIILAVSELVAGRQQQPRTLEQMNWLDSILIGLAQALALAPGISRSGSTIATGLGRGIRRDLAARFSFLLGTPIIFGAGLLQLVEVLSSDASEFTNQWVPIVVGFIAAAVAGTFAITFLLRYLRSHSLYVFSVYCVLLGLATIVWSFVR
jgi:undecaprenyl-diphosphatase